jgi:hypothetical protein
MDEGFCIIEFLDGPHGPLSDYVHIEANAAYARHAGITNAVGQRVRQMVPLEADGWVELYRDVLTTGKPIRFQRELVATGRHLELSAFRIEPPELRQVAVLFQDVTPRRKAEVALKQLNETLEARVAEALAERKVLAGVVESTDALVQVLDMNFCLVALNSAAAEEFKRSFGVEPRPGDNLISLMQEQPDEQERARSVWTRALSGEEFVAFAAVAGASGKRQFEMRFYTLKDANGRQNGAYQFVYDVTARHAEQERLRIAEEALRQSQKMEAVGHLTGGIAHDFNNMLAVIISSLRLAQRRLDRGETDIREFIGSAMGGAQRAATLVSRLLAFSRQQPLAPVITDANALLGGMEEVLRRTIPESIRIEFVRAGGLWKIFADPHGLENALVNLVVNARDAMPLGGRLTIETANAFLDDNYAAAHQDVTAGAYVQIAVTDTGSGMDADVVARAFEPFFTTKGVGAGTGLGLSQVYGFVKQSKGHVKIYSEIGVGTTVKLYFPRQHEKPAEKALVPDAATVMRTPGAGQLVLVVEDDDDVRRLTVDTVRELGYSVISAESGRKALALLLQHADVALLMTDVVMPEMNGRQLADEAVKIKPALKVLYTSGYTRSAIVHNGAIEEGVELIVKPFTFEGLGAKLAAMLEHR